MKKTLFVLAVVPAAWLWAASAAPASWAGPDLAHAAEKAKKYFCPMHPDYTSARPGDCPICHMRLVPVESAGTAEAAHQHATHAKPGAPSDDPKSICLMHECPMEKAGKPCAMLVVSNPGEEIKCPHCKQRVEAAAASSAPSGYTAVLVSPEKQQLIGLRKEAVRKKSFKKTVRASARVAHDTELYQTQAEYLESLRSLEKSGGAEWAKSLVEASRTRLRRMGLADDLIAELEKAGQPDRSLLYADPESGAWVYANIYEYELPYVKPGDVLTVELPSQPGQTASGEVRSIDPTVDPMTRTVRIRARVPNPQSLLKPDMYVTARLSSDLGEAVTVPSEAVFFTGSEAVVFVDKGQGLLEPRRIVTGARGENELEVVSGLREGEAVVTNGNFLIDSESRLRAALGATTTAAESGASPASATASSGHEGHAR